VARLQEEKNAGETRFPTLPTLFKPILHIVLLVGRESRRKGQRKGNVSHFYIHSPTFVS